MRKPSKRTWLIVLGISSIAAGITLALVRPFSPAPVAPEWGEIPAEWFAAPVILPPATTDTPVVEVERDEDAADLHRVPLPLGYVQTGRLAYDLDGKRVAEEVYRLERSTEDTVRLTSSGSFFFRVLFVTVSVAFEQEIELDGELRPRSYTLETRGPLGFGNQRVSITVDGATAMTTVGGERRELVLPEGNALFAGTLAAYVILPSLHEARAADGVLLLTSIGAGTGPGGRPRAESSGEGTGDLRRQEGVEVEVGGSMLVLDRYRAQTGGFGGTLLARGAEFVAFLGEGERALTAYRLDLFPRGIPRTVSR